MAFYTKIDYSRQLKQSGTTSVVLSGSSKHWGNVWANNPTGYSYNNGYVADSYTGNSGYTFVVQTSGDTNYGDGRVASYGASITSYSGYASGNTVLAIGQKPIPPIDISAGSVSITASCVQLATSNLISAAATDLGIDTLGNVVKDTSSLKFKYDIDDIGFSNLDKLLDLSPKKFKWKSNNTSDWGYIAEEVESLGLTDFVSYEGGLPHSVKYKKLTIMLIEYLKKYGHNNSKTEIKCNCPTEEFIVLSEDTTHILNRDKTKKYIIKSLANCSIKPDMGLIDNEWESLEMSPESCVEFRFYEPLSSWMIVSSDGIKES
jgi:hypothetical protein